LAAYWYNGREYIKLYGSVDQNGQVVGVQSSMLGTYQVRGLTRAEGAEFDVSGMSNKAIGDELGLSDNTVRNHLGNILEKLGLEKELALELSVQTLAGSAEMLKQKMGTPDDLRNAVTSKGGTTAAGLAVLEKAKFRGLVSDVLNAAEKRSKELGELAK